MTSKTIPACFLVVSLILVSCMQKKSKPEPTVNKFSDSVIVSIHEYKDHRNTQMLIPFLENANPKYQKEAALALASVGDSTAIIPLTDAFVKTGEFDEKTDLQRTIALALLQSFNWIGIKEFTKLYDASINNGVREIVLWLLGRHGSKSHTTSQYLTNGLNSLTENYTEDKLGVVRGFYEYAVRKHWSEEMIATALEFAQPENEVYLKILSAAYIGRLSRFGQIEIENAFIDEPHNFQKSLINLIKNEANPLVKLHLVDALLIFNNPQKTELIKGELSSGNDYRVTVSLINAIDDRAYEDLKLEVIKFIGSENEHIETAAAKFFANSGTYKDSALYRELYGKARYWEAKNQLIKARLYHRLTTDINFKYLYTSLENAPNEWARAQLYTTMGNNPIFLDSLTSLYARETNQTAKTYCLEAICNLIIKFDKSLDNERHLIYKFKKGRVIDKIIDALFIEDGFSAYTAASKLQSPVFNMQSSQNLIPQIDSLLKVWTLPVYYETHVELQKLKMAIMDQKLDDFHLDMPFNNPIDWDFVKTIPKDQKLKITTEKGEIVIELDVENAPGTVGYIAKLAKAGFYNNLIWHRVVQNFVIQGGDPFGNGTGSATGSLRSEHSLNEYKEGTVGIASAGKDTESCQFFITHNFTPHLNGRYTIIGYVVKGMDVVHKTQVNHKILKVELL